MKKLFPSVVFLSFIFSLVLTSCATKPVPQKISASTSDAEADASLGALPKKGPTEAEKEAAMLEEEDSTTKALREIHKRDTQEEAQRLQRSITEFDLTEKRQ